MSKSDILGPIAYLSDIKEFGIILKGYVWRLQFQYRTIFFLFFLYQDHHIEVNAWSIMNGVQIEGPNNCINTVGVIIMG